MFHTIIFDVGGTLVGAPDMFQELTKAFSGVSREEILYEKIKHGVMRGIQDAQSEFKNVEGIIKTTLSGISAELGCEDMGKYARELYRDIWVKKAYLYEDTVQTLEGLKSLGVNMLAASDGDAELLYEEFRNFSLTGYFSKIFVSSEIGGYKPGVRFVDAVWPFILEPVSEVAIVGDSVVDIQTGERLGIRTILKGETVPGGIVPDYQIKNLSEIFRAVKG